MAKGKRVKPRWAKYKKKPIVRESKPESRENIIEWEKEKFFNFIGRDIDRINAEKINIDRYIQLMYLKRALLNLAKDFVNDTLQDASQCRTYRKVYLDRLVEIEMRLYSSVLPLNREKTPVGICYFDLKDRLQILGVKRGRVFDNPNLMEAYDILDDIYGAPYDFCECDIVDIISVCQDYVVAIFDSLNKEDLIGIEQAEIKIKNCLARIRERIIQKKRTTKINDKIGRAIELK